MEGNHKCLEVLAKILSEHKQKESFYMLAKNHPKFKINTLKKIEQQNPAVIFSTVLDLVNHLGYEITIKKRD